MIPTIFTYSSAIVKTGTVMLDKKHNSKNMIIDFAFALPLVSR
jgi:hypothetical protein